MKIKVFLWLLIKINILTTDNLIHRGWRKKDDKCQFCGSKESISHLFFKCPLARYVWQVVVCAFNLKNSPRFVSKFMGD